jgi:hypothetical protein
MTLAAFLFGLICGLALFPLCVWAAYALLAKGLM